MVTKLGIERLLGDDLDSPAQEIFKVEDETRRKPRTRGRPDINEDIDIAFGSGLAACDGAKDPDIVCSVSGCDALDVVALFAEKLFESHDLLLWICSRLQSYLCSKLMLVSLSVLNVLSHTLQRPGMSRAGHRVGSMPWLDRVMHTEFFLFR